jgi:hypothetical protein
METRGDIVSDTELGYYFLRLNLDNGELEIKVFCLRSSSITHEKAKPS